MRWLLLLQLWSSLASPDKPTLLFGNWQSCIQDDGRYGERIYDHCVLKKCDWSLHLGPDRSFGLYRYDENPPDEHDSHEDSLLHPSTVEGTTQHWEVLGLSITVSEGGGSLTSCTSFIVEVK